MRGLACYRAPMTSLVKICGLTRAVDVACAIENGASFLGFIVEAASKRRLSTAEAAALALPAKGIIPRVAVTVNADDELLTRIMAEMAPDYIQCHGDESPARVAEIAARFHVKTIKACAVSTSSDIMTAEHYAGAADIILYDAKPPAGDTVRGGHGLSFDWNILTQSPLPKTWALAGGLTPDTVREALRRTRAPILDISSGVEVSPGIKNPLKIKALLRAAQQG